MKTFKYILAPVLLTVAFLVGCSSDKGGSSTRNPNLGFRNEACVNCGFTERALVTGLGEVNYQAIGVQVSLDFFGDAAMGSYYVVNQAALRQYRGPVGALGDLLVDVDNECHLAAGGRYELTTLSAGQMANADISNLRLQGVLVDPGYSGRATGELIVVSISQAFVQGYTSPKVDYNGNPHDYRIQSFNPSFRIESVGGFPCNRTYVLE